MFEKKYWSEYLLTTNISCSTLKHDFLDALNQFRQKWVMKYTWIIIFKTTLNLECIFVFKVIFSFNVIKITIKKYPVTVYKVSFKVNRTFLHYLHKQMYHQSPQRIGMSSVGNVMYIIMNMHIKHSSSRLVCLHLSHTFNCISISWSEQHFLLSV